jgi:integrase
MWTAAVSCQSPGVETKVSAVFMDMSDRAISDPHFQENEMAGIEKLTAVKVSRISKPGKYADGRGLYLQVTKTLVKSWLFRYELDKVEHAMGLGPVHTVGLADARELARKARLLLNEGIDPMQHKAEAIEKAKAVKAKNKIFNECMAEYIKSHKESWTNEKHQKQWEKTLLDYACPHFGKMNIRLVNTELVLRALEPIWKTKTETATRVRERLERVLSWASTMGYREGENPARWHGHLQELLPAPGKIKKVKHHPSLPYMELGAFYRLLQVEKGIAARALQFTILTACRTSEVIFAKWEEFDFIRGVWEIPPERMKAKKLHRVPLVKETLEILERVQGLDPVWVFPGRNKGCPMSNMAMSNVLERMQRSDITVHGFRSSFRVWVAEQTEYPKDMAELALAHAVGTAVEVAYQRSDLFERRRVLMKDWVAWCKVVRPSGQVTTLAPPPVVTEVAATPGLASVKPGGQESPPNRSTPVPTPGCDGDLVDCDETMWQGILSQTQSSAIVAVLRETT